MHFLEENTLWLKPERCSALCMLGKFSCFPCRLLTFFSKLTFSKNVYDTNSSGPDQDRFSVDPDLGPNCLQRLSADDKSL